MYRPETKKNKFNKLSKQTKSVHTNAQVYFEGFYLAKVFLLFMSSICGTDVYF
jgi:hypothetical protein